jgi:competence protein ComEA
VEGLNDKLNQYKLPIALSLVGIVLIIGGIFSSGLTSTFSQSSSKATYAKSSPKASSSPSEQVSSKVIKVDISGAVREPGVYTLNKDSRVEDALRLSGGFAASASGEYISRQLNLSQKLSDGQKIYIPFEGEKLVGSVAGAATNLAGVQGKVAINSATTDQLDSLPGVGPVTVQKIIAGRPYQDLQELVIKKAVSKSVYDKIKDLVDLN